STEGVANGEATLLHGGGGQGGKTNDVAGGVNVRHFSLVVGVDLDAFAVVGNQADVFQAQSLRGALPANRVHQAVSLEEFAGLEFGLDHFAGFGGGVVAGGGAVDLLDFGDLFAEAEGDAALPHLVLQGFNDFAVEEVE